MVKISLLVGLVLFIFVFQSILAHTSGQSLEKVEGDYLIDVGYNVAEDIVSGEVVHFDFNVKTKDNKTVDFTSVWVRLAPETDIVFASHIAIPGFGLPAMSYTFPRAGNYELTVRFLNGEDQIVETFFPLTVKKSTHGIKFYLTTIIIPGAVGFVLGATIAVFIKKRRRMA